MKRILLLATTTMLCLSAAAQTNYDVSKLSTEKLDRGIIAVRQDDGKVFISWRVLRDDAKGEAFDVYRYTTDDLQQGREGQKLNTLPLTSSGSWFIDEQPLNGQDAVYEVRTARSQQRETGASYTLKADAPVGYLPITLNKPEGGQVPTIAQNNQRSQRFRRGQQPQRTGAGQQSQRPRWRDNGQYSYTASDATVADVDGDGQYEIILKWDPTNARDNSHDGYTGPTLFDCYRLNGEQLWRIDMGRNIRSGAHYVQFIAYDFDGDGCAELMVKTADGTTDGQGRILRNGRFVESPAADSNSADTIPDYRNNRGRIIDGPEYLTVFNGLTGAAMDTKPYVPERGEVRGWGDSNGNRSERYLAGMGYFGAQSLSPSGEVGKGLPSALFCRGYYTRTVIAAWDWDGHELKNRWTFDTNNKPWRSYAGQGNHNLRIADVDGDGLDEITYGSMAVDHDGRGLYNTGFGHGDAIHLIADPKDGQLYIWDCHENRRDGSDLRNARTGKVVFQIKSKTDVGRCMAADIDPTNPGCEMWSSDSHGIRTMKGDVLHNTTDADDPQHDNSLVLNGRWLSMNFGIWWDGDLLRELLDHQTVSKYDWQNRQIVDLQRFDGQFNNGTKSNPCLAADILGDWREEVLIRNRESTELRLYTTTIPTDYRINCLMQDIPYRISVATQNVAYNQPSEPGYYIGPDRTDYMK